VKMGIEKTKNKTPTAAQSAARRMVSRPASAASCLPRR
jgi:hypothetical protein